MGPMQQSLCMMAIRNGRPIPERIKNAPVLKTGLELYLNAFFDLDSERINGMGIGRIPFSTVAFYASYYRFDVIQTERLFYFIRVMDVEYVKYLDSKNSDKETKHERSE